MNKPKIIVCGILDTKGREIKYLKEKVVEAGGEAKIMELSVGKEVGWADISLSEVLKEIDEKPENIFKKTRDVASNIVIEAGKKYINKLYENGEVDGIITCGGSMGATIATSIMQELPIGIPKMVLSTAISGDVSHYLGSKDICLMYPIAEAGLNVVTKEILSRAAGGVVGMANAPLDMIEEESKPLIGCMMYGVTTPCCLMSTKYFEDKGDYDIIIYHATGIGGKTMEELIEDGVIKGVLDITTSELVNEEFGGVITVGPDRLNAAARKGIPQVVAPGGMDIINFGSEDTIPKEHQETIGKPGKSLYLHNPSVSCIGTSPDEMRIIAKEMGEKLSKSTGPVSFFIPLKGWSAVDMKEPNIELGWSGPGSAPVWIEDDKNPNWSKRSTVFLDELKKHLDTSKDNIEIIVLDLHLNQPKFADLMSKVLDDMLNDDYEKGKYDDLSYVVESR